ncbi:MAG: glycine cleavage system aminomethyltransferase GcvT [Planctomycetaceae bacterium]
MTKPLRTPLANWHAAHGGRIVDFAGWEMPIQYTSIVEEHTAVRERAGMFDVCHMGRILFTGPDAESFLDQLLTNDVTKLRVGQVRYSLVCDRGGGVLDDVLVYRVDAGTWMLVVNASNREKILAWIEHHMEGYTLSATDQTADRFMFAIQGPRALDILQRHTPLGLAAMKYYSIAPTEVATCEALASRTGYTGEDGFEVIVPAAQAERVWTTVFESGQPDGLLPCGLGCRDTLRLEAAMPLYGHELDETIDPITAGLGFAVKLQAGLFIGRSALQAAKDRTDRPQRVGIELAGKRIARQGAAVFVGDDLVGHVTSGTFSPTLQKSIAMAYIAAPHAMVGRELEVDLRGKREPARVVPLPFYLRSK